MVDMDIILSIDPSAISMLKTYFRAKKLKGSVLRRSSLMSCFLILRRTFETTLIRIIFSVGLINIRISPSHGMQGIYGHFKPPNLL